MSCHSRLCSWRKLGWTEWACGRIGLHWHCGGTGRVSVARGPQGFNRVVGEPQVAAACCCCSCCCCCCIHEVNDGVVLQTGHGNRFDPARNKKYICFTFWKIQALWEIVTTKSIELCHFSGGEPPAWNAIDSAGSAVWVAWLAAEVIADQQKRVPSGE